jgi:hypothetical protein
MARKSLNELRAQAVATLEDNTTFNISPLDVRAMILDFIEAIQPAYGLLTIVGNTTQTVNIAPSLMVFTAA